MRGLTVRGRSFAAEVEGWVLRALGRGVEAGGAAGVVGGVAGVAASFAEGAAAVASGLGVAAGGAEATLGPADGVTDGDASAGEDDEMGAGGVGGAATSVDGRMMRFSMNELTDDTAASARWRAALTSATYPETCRPTPTTPRKVFTSMKTMSAIIRVRMG